MVAVADDGGAASRKALIVVAGVPDAEDAEIRVVLERGLPVSVIIHVGAIAFVIHLLLCTDGTPDRAIPGSGRRPLPHDVAEHPLVIGATEYAEVVRLEPGATPIVRRLPQPIAGLLCQSRIETVSVEATAGRVQAACEQP